MTPDFEMVDRVFCALADREESQGSETIDEIERVVLLVWHSWGVIGNGGFDLFFHRELPLRATLDAYALLGIEPAAHLLTRLISLFPSQRVPEDWNECMALIEKLSDEIDAIFYSWSLQYESTQTLMIQQLAGWIRVHDDVFHTLIASPHSETD